MENSNCGKLKLWKLRKMEIEENENCGNRKLSKMEIVENENTRLDIQEIYDIKTLLKGNEQVCIIFYIKIEI